MNVLLSALFLLWPKNSKQDDIDMFPYGSDAFKYIMG